MRTARTDLLFMRASASKEDGVETLAPRLAPVTRRGTIQGPGASPTLEAPRIRQVAARHALTGQGCAGCVWGDGHRRQGQSRGGPLDAPSQRVVSSWSPCPVWGLCFHGRGCSRRHRVTPSRAVRDASLPTLENAPSPLLKQTAERTTNEPLTAAVKRALRSAAPPEI